MKNKAFTMSEALIVLSLVSVLAALSVTAVTKAKPDESIIMFRRAYSMVTRITNDLINDTELYPEAHKNFASTEGADILNATTLYKGLADYTLTNEMLNNYKCLTEGTDTDIRAKMKFPNLFAYKANAVTIEERGVSDGTPYIVFTTPDGMRWKIYGYERTSPNKVAAAINIYTTGTTSGCFYNATSCPVPTRFLFLVYIDGTIKVVNNNWNKEPMGCSYVRYPKITKAKDIPTDPTVNPCFAN